jgi:hypothetical protein
VEHRDLHVMRWTHCSVDAAGEVSADEVVDRVCAAVRDEARKAGAGLVATRITLSGPSKAHGALSADPKRWVNEIRGAVTDVTDGTAWVEKVLIATEAKTDLEAALMRKDILGDLLHHVSDLQSSPGLLSALRDDLMQLKRKIPPEALEGESALNLEHPECVAQVLKDVRHMLMSRLLAAGGDR